MALRAALLCLALPVLARAQNPNLIEYRGDQGPGLGKHVVLLAGDHEYRSEESLPALARILAKRFGFKCSVFFTTNPATGFIEPGSSHIAGETATHLAVLDFLCAHEPDLLAAAEALGLDPGELAAMRERLA